MQILQGFLVIITQISPTLRLNRSISAVAKNPIVQVSKSAVLPNPCRTAPASTEAIGISPCDEMLMTLLTLLSLSRSTMRMSVVVVGR